MKHRICPLSIPANINYNANKLKIYILPREGMTTRLNFNLYSNEFFAKYSKNILRNVQFALQICFDKIYENKMIVKCGCLNTKYADDKDSSTFSEKCRSVFYMPIQSFIYISKFLRKGMSKQVLSMLKNFHSILFIR